LTKFSHPHEQVRFAKENLPVCMGLWALQRHRQASQYTKQLESFNYKPFGGFINEFASDMFLK